MISLQMKQAYIQLVAEQLANNCVLSPGYSEEQKEYGCSVPGCTFKAEFQKNHFYTTSPHSCFSIDKPQPDKRLMRYGDKIILSFSFDEMFEIVLTEGGRFDCRYGEFEHS